MNICVQCTGVFFLIKPVFVELGKHDDSPGETVDGDDTEDMDKLRAALMRQTKNKQRKQQETRLLRVLDYKNS